MTRILVVDDELSLLNALLINLRARGYEVQGSRTGREALAKVTSFRPEIVVLDLGLPDMDGLSVLDGVRGWNPVPVIVLSARSASQDKIDALEHGADDYMTKPFDMGELIARLRAIARRSALLSHESGEELVDVGDFVVDRSKGQVTRDDSVVRLTPTQWHLLDVLAANHGKLVTQRDLLMQVWGPGYDNHGNYLRVHVAALRQKLERDPANPQHIVTEPGLGYRLV